MVIYDVLGKTDTTDSDELYRLGKKSFGSNFIGVYSSNNTPLINNNNCLIFNSKDSSHPGEHWLGMIKICGKVYVYDTFNRPLTDINKSFKNKPWICLPHQRLESIYGKDCGQHVMAWLSCIKKFGIDGFYTAFSI